MVCSASFDMSATAGPPISRTWNRHDAGPSTRTMWWNTSRAITPGCSLPTRSTRVVCGTRSETFSMREGLEHVATQAHGQRAEGAELADVPVEMHGEGARRGVAHFGRHLVADALPLVELHVVDRGPLARALVQLFFGRRDRRDHVVDEDAEALGLGHLGDAEVVLQLLEDHVGVAGKVVGQHEVGLGHDLVAGVHERQAGRAREDLFRDREAHGDWFRKRYRRRGFSRPSAGRASPGS